MIAWAFLKMTVSGFNKVQGAYDIPLIHRLKILIENLWNVLKKALFDSPNINIRS